jgi:hypothetical protein
MTSLIFPKLIRSDVFDGMVTLLITQFMIGKPALTHLFSGDETGPQLSNTECLRTC